MLKRIGLSMNYHVTEDGEEQVYLDKEYYELLEAFGAIALPIVPTENVVRLDAVLHQIDGLLLTGGLDIDPALWQERPHPQTRIIHPCKQRFDFMLYEYAQKHRLPIMGICLGMQIMNVAQGGSLIQYLPDVELKEPLDHGSESRITKHRIRLEKRSRLYEWLQTEQVTVNSTHQQGINRLGTGLVAAATANDGLIEAIERADYPFLLGVQWHPEHDRDNPVTCTMMERFLAATGPTA